jgi:Na+-transporting methylmalonyl-CoA/oxaloacetate decarboxylase gamma subunit
MNPLLFGLQISALGITLVFAVLLVLWGLLELIGRLDHRSPAQTGAVRAPVTPALPDDGAAAQSAARSAEDAELVAVMAAVTLHAARQRRQAAPAARSYWPGSLLFASRWVAAGRMRQNGGNGNRRR